MSRQWYYAQQGQQVGPVTDQQLKQLADSGHLQPANLVWTKGMEAWKRAETIKGLMPATLEPPPMPEPVPSNPAGDPPLGFLDASTQPPSAPTPVGGSTASFLDTLQSKSATTARQVVQEATALSQSDAVTQRLAAAKDLLFGAGRNQPAAGATVSPGPSVDTSSSPPRSNATSDAAPAHVPTSSMIAEAPVVYMGGHPDHIDSAEGNLRLTAAGIEFVPTSPESPVRLFNGYEAVVEITNIKGRLPDSYLEMLRAKANKGKWLGFAASTAASFVPHVGSRVTGAIDKGVNMAVAGSGPGGQVPLNRICVLMRLEGTKYKVLFDALGDAPDAMEASAQRFCNLSVKVRGRFGKPPSRPKSGDASSPTGGTERTVPTESPIVKKVVACPQCKAKVRTAKPGIIVCPKCQTKIRVSESLFSN